MCSCKLFASYPPPPPPPPPLPLMYGGFLKHLFLGLNLKELIYLHPNFRKNDKIWIE